MTGLAAVVVFTVLLPLAGASAEPEPLSVPDDAKAAAVNVPGNAQKDAPGNAPQCGPELSSPEGIEGQTCVLTEDGSTWARTYYRNATGTELRSVLTLMGPAGRTVQMHCPVSAQDEPGVCETPREPSRGKADEYSAVSEFAAAGDGPLLLRSGSNSVAPAPR
ncbi:hypothetical protein [Streptomyces sp. ISL-96]|uniref:hypothetical protein n=1 Tax=Streptomyces sp. ISL-96 TaxID=2819191 RepID=UPI002035C54C|nr:hypothetical protein [Streptomyces sp. ISL-96]